MTDLKPDVYDTPCCQCGRKVFLRTEPKPAAIYLCVECKRNYWDAEDIRAERAFAARFPGERDR